MNETSNIDRRDTTIAIADLFIALNDLTDNPQYYENMVSAVTYLNEAQDDADTYVPDTIVDYIGENGRKMNEKVLFYILDNYKLFHGKTMARRMYDVYKYRLAPDEHREEVNEILKTEAGEGNSFHENMAAWEYNYASSLIRMAQQVGAFDYLVAIRNKLVAITKPDTEA